MDRRIESLSDEEQLKQLQQALKELERKGLVRRTGEYRNGRPVYALTEYICGTA